MPFQKAVKYGSKLRLALAGPSGAGKTYTALTLACALAGGKPVAVIDTERGSASKYALTKDGQGFDFDVMELTNYHPQRYIDAIHEAEQAGYAVLVIDSLTHAWNSVGGVLEIVDNAAKRSQSKNTFNAWGEGTKIQNQLIDAITRSNMHIICTMRSKTEYVIEQVNGKNMPRKVGMAPIQRQDIEYEYDVYAEMTVENTMLVQKSRCSELSGQVIEKPGSEVAAVLDAWLAGDPPPVKAPTYREVYATAKGKKLCHDAKSFCAYIATVIGVNVAPDQLAILTPEQVSELARAVSDEQAA